MVRLIQTGNPNKFSSNDFDIIKFNAPYRVSTQGAIWNVDALRGILKVGESAWEFEINGTKRSSLDKSRNSYL